MWHLHRSGVVDCSDRLASLYIAMSNRLSVRSGGQVASTMLAPMSAGRSVEHVVARMRTETKGLWHRKERRRNAVRRKVKVLDEPVHRIIGWAST